MPHTTVRTHPMAEHVPESVCVCECVGVCVYICAGEVCVVEEGRYFQVQIPGRANIVNQNRIS